MKIKITPAEDGHSLLSQHMKYEDEHGNELNGLIAMDIRYRRNELVTAKMEFYMNADVIEANAFMAKENLETLAKHHGFKLVPLENEDENS